MASADPRELILRRAAASLETALDEIDAYLLSRLDGPTSLSDLCDLLPYEADETTLRTLRLVHTGVLEIVHTTPELHAAEKVAEAPPAIDPALVEKLRPALALFERMAGLSDHEILGLRPEAKLAEIRAAYFRLSKQCHPDIFFRQAIGSHRDTLALVFDRLTRAYETMRQNARKRERDAPAQPAPCDAPNSAPPTKVEAPSTFSPKPSVAQPAPLSPEQAAERLARRRTLIAQSLERATGAQRTSRPNLTAHVAPARASTPSDAARDLLRELDRRKPSAPSRPSHSGIIAASARVEIAASLAGLSPLGELARQLAGEGTEHAQAAKRVEQADEQERSGKIRDAANLLRLALSKCSDERIRRAYDHLDRQARLATLDLQRARAENAEAEGAFQAAANAWMGIVELAPDDAAAAHHAAFCLLEVGDVRTALRYAKQAANEYPDHAGVRETLLACYDGLSMTSCAARERETLKRLTRPVTESRLSRVWPFARKGRQA